MLQRSTAVGLVFCAGMIFAALPALAETGPIVAAPAQSDAATRRSELARLQDEIKLSDETVERLQAEIRGLDADRQKLRTQLVETGSRARETETKVAAAEARLAGLTGDEAGIKTSLKARQGVLIEVIAALQRMGHRPPPALLVRPEDALESVRTAMMLGAVLPQMREQTEALAADLARLTKVRADITAERDSEMQSLQALAEDRKRIDLLVEERQKVLAQQERSLVNEQVRAASLGRDAASLKDLIARMENEIASARKAADQAAASTAALAKQPPVLRPSLAALDNPGRLAPALPFDQAKGLLTLPVTGIVARAFGSDDGNGGQEKGLSLATTGDATVTAPCDGWVVFAGNFRSYGQLLIIDAGGGYHVIMAGMDKINVAQGQFVLTGEPVAAMGSDQARAQGPDDGAETASGAEATTAALNGASGTHQPALYIEFRKDGVSIDPTPWWSNQGEKARG